MYLSTDIVQRYPALYTHCFQSFSFQETPAATSSNLVSEHLYYCYNNQFENFNEVNECNMLKRTKSNACNIIPRNNDVKKRNSEYESIHLLLLVFTPGYKSEHVS
jgi:hypothetical protein